MSFFATTIILTVITEDAPFTFRDFEDVHQAITHGDASGQWDSTSKELTPQEAADALLAQGSDPEFMGIQVSSNNRAIGIGYDEVEPIVDAAYVTVWDGSVTVRTSCKYNIQTDFAFDVETSDIEGLDQLDEEYVELADGTIIQRDDYRLENEDEEEGDDRG